MRKLIVISTLIILIVGLFFCSFILYEKSKKLQNNLKHLEEINKELAKNNLDLSSKSTKIDIVYNKRTGELYPMFTDDMIPSVCVWTMQGERESNSIVVTRAGDDGWYYNYNENKDMAYYAYPVNYGGDSIVFNKNNGTFIGFTKYDWIGHLLNNEIKVIKDMKFLPPRAPIYVNCIDSQNRNYHGLIGEYKLKK